MTFLLSEFFFIPSTSTSKSKSRIVGNCRYITYFLIVGYVKCAGNQKIMKSPVYPLWKERNGTWWTHKIFNHTSLRTVRFVFWDHSSGKRKIQIWCICNFVNRICQQNKNLQMYRHYTTHTNTKILLALLWLGWLVGWQTSVKLSVNETRTISKHPSNSCLLFLASSDIYV